MSRGCPHFLAAVYFICCKQTPLPPPLLTACHAPRQTLGALSVVASHWQSSFSFLFSAFSAFFFFFLSLFSSLWLVLHSALKMRFSCCSAQSLSRSSTAREKGGEESGGSKWQRDSAPSYRHACRFFGSQHATRIVLTSLLSPFHPPPPPCSFLYCNCSSSYRIALHAFWLICLAYPAELSTRYLKFQLRRELSKAK